MSLSVSSEICRTQRAFELTLPAFHKDYICLCYRNDTYQESADRAAHLPCPDLLCLKSGKLHTPHYFR